MLIVILRHTQISGYVPIRGIGRYVRQEVRTHYIIIVAGERRAAVRPMSKTTRALTYKRFYNKL